VDHLLNWYDISCYLSSLILCWNSEQYSHQEVSQMTTYCIASNLQSKEYEWFTYDNHRLYKYNETPVPMSSVQLAGLYADKYSDDVKVPTFQ
jgi:hypothetical protein